MGNLNMVILSGRVGQDPEVKVFDNGGMKTTFTMATSKKWKTTEGEQKEETQWHRIETWGGLSKLVEGWVKKGYMIVVHGEIVYERYTDKDGYEKTITKIRAQSIDIGTSSNRTENGNGGHQSPPTHPGMNSSVPAENDDDLPF